MKKNVFFSVLIVMLFSFALVQTAVKASAAPYSGHTKQAVIHGCDILGEATYVQSQINCHTYDLDYAPASSLMEAMNEGYLLAYVDTFKAYGMIPQDFVPTVKSGTSGSESKVTSTPKAPTLTETEAATYVVVKSSEVYDGFDGGKKTGTVLDPDTEVTVNGYTSNSYYRLEDGTYVPKSGVATKADYDAAWSVSEETPATCTEAGSVKSVNALSGKESEEIIEALGHDYAMTDYVEPTCTEAGYDTYVCNACGDSYTEEIAATGHEAGEPKITVEPKTFSKGVKTTYCSVCKEVLTEEEIPQTFPVPLWGVIAIAVVVVGGIATGVVLVIKKKRK